MTLCCGYIDPSSGDCHRPPEFEITDLAETDPYLLTHSCVEHVGKLLGHDPQLPDDAEDRWDVRALSAEEVAHRG